MNNQISFGKIEFRGFIFEGMKLFLNELAKILLNNKHFMQLHDNATQQGQIFVVFKDSDKLFCEAEWNSTSRTISICDDLDFIESLDSLIFELCNASNALINSEYMLLDRFKNEVDYAFAMEHCEFFYTTLPYRKILPTILLDSKIIELLKKYDSNIDDQAIHDYVEIELKSDTDFASDWDLQNQPRADNEYSHAEVYKQEYQLWKKIKEEQPYGSLLKSGENYLEHIRLESSQYTHTR
ncbi:MAG: hypothetical protein U1E78_10055 [Gammaproteobacteria bacterium]